MEKERLQQKPKWHRITATVLIVMIAFFFGRYMWRSIRERFMLSSVIKDLYVPPYPVVEISRDSALLSFSSDNFIRFYNPSQQEKTVVFAAEASILVGDDSLIPLFRENEFERVQIAPRSSLEIRNFLTFLTAYDQQEDAFEESGVASQESLTFPLNSMLLNEACSKFDGAVQGFLEVKIMEMSENECTSNNAVIIVPFSADCVIQETLPGILILPFPEVDMESQSNLMHASASTGVSLENNQTSDQVADSAAEKLETSPSHDIPSQIDQVVKA